MPEVSLRTGAHTVILMPLRPSSRGIVRGSVCLVLYGVISLLHETWHVYVWIGPCTSLAADIGWFALLALGHMERSEMAVHTPWRECRIDRSPGVQH